MWKYKINRPLGRFFIGEPSCLRINIQVVDSGNKTSIKIAEISSYCLDLEIIR